jgi:hypothetical protein
LINLSEQHASAIPSPFSAPEKENPTETPIKAELQ